MYIGSKVIVRLLAYGLPPFLDCYSNDLLPRAIRPLWPRPTAARAIARRKANVTLAVRAAVRAPNKPHHEKITVFGTFRLSDFRIEECEPVVLYLVSYELPASSTWI